MRYLLVLLIVFLTNINANENQKINEKIESLEKPLYTPFVENYILHELRLLRDENRDLKIQLHEKLAKKEVEISNNVINYATSTINNMFYIIAAACSILVIIGWNSIRDINEKVKNVIDEKTSKTIQKYEERMIVFEKDLEKRAKQVKQNEQEIEIMNTIHSLWLRATQESTPSGKIEIYDEILELRPDDVEAMVFKAESVLDLNEANWSLNLTNQAIEIDNNYANAFYQRAKAYAVLKQDQFALEDLEKAVALNDEYINEMESDKVFRRLLSGKDIKELFA